MSSGWCDKLSLHVTGADGKFSKEQNTCLFTINVNVINISVEWEQKKNINFAYNDHNSRSRVNNHCLWPKISPSKNNHCCL